MQLGLDGEARSVGEPEPPLIGSVGLEPKHSLSLEILLPGPTVNMLIH